MIERYTEIPDKFEADPKYAEAVRLCGVTAETLSEEDIQERTAALADKIVKCHTRRFGGVKVIDPRDAEAMVNVENVTRLLEYIRNIPDDPDVFMGSLSDMNSLSWEVKNAVAELADLLDLLETNVGSYGREYVLACLGKDDNSAVKKNVHDSIMHMIQEIGPENVIFAERNVVFADGTSRIPWRNGVVFILPGFVVKQKGRWLPVHGVVVQIRPTPNDIQSAVRAWPLGDMEYNGGTYYGHLRSEDGWLCMGDGQPLIGAALPEGRLVDVLDVVYTLASDPKDTDSYALATYGRGYEQCKGCGEWVWCTAQCEKCLVTCPITGCKFLRHKGILVDGQLVHESATVASHITKQRCLRTQAVKCPSGLRPAKIHPDDIGECCITGVPGFKTTRAGRKVFAFPKHTTDLVPMRNGEWVSVGCLPFVNVEDLGISPAFITVGDMVRGTATAGVYIEKVRNLDTSGLYPKNIVEAVKKAHNLGGGK